MPNPDTITPVHNRLLATLSSEVSTLLGGAPLILAHVLNRYVCRHDHACAADALDPGRT